MKHRLSILLKILLLIAALGFVQELSAQGWIKHYGTNQDDRATSLVNTQDGGYFIAGYNWDPQTNNQNQYLLKTDVNGNLQWEELSGPFFINAAWHADEYYTGDVLVTGERFNGSSVGDVYIEQRNPAGDSIWSKLFNFPNFQRGEFIMETPDHGFLIVGISQNLAAGPASDQDLFILRADSVGDTLWTRQYGGPGNDEGVMAIETDDGGFAVVGALRDVSGNQSDFYLVRIDSLGDSLWTRTFTQNEKDFCSGIAPTGDGGFLLAGHTVVNQQLSVVEEWVVRVDSVGDSLWSNTVGNAASGGENKNIVPMDDGGFVLCSYDELIRIDSLGAPIWNRTYQDYVITDLVGTPDGGLMLTGTFNNPPLGNDLFLMKTDAQGNVYSNLIQGHVFRDQLQNCQFDPGDSAHVNWLVRAEPGGHTTTTDSSGFFEFRVDTGTTTLSVVPINGYWAPDCPQSGQLVVQFPTTYDTVTGMDFSMEPIIQCPRMRVNLGTPFLRPCFNNIYTVNYCNEGTVDADSVYITVELDSFIIVDSTQISYRTPQTGNTYLFDIGTVAPGQCGSFDLYCTLSCTAVIGQSHCSQAVIFPDSNCLPIDTAWDGSSVALTAECELSPDSVKFTIKNEGINGMSSPGGLMVLEDDILKVQRNFQLGSGLDTVIRVPGNGSTWVLIADQSPGHPGLSRPIITLEGCGRDTAGDFSRGFVTRYPTDDADVWIDIDCRQNGAAYDPNIKTAIPVGQGSAHKILYSHDLEYTIHFQNTGNDTAFTVVVRDTLPTELDLNTLQLGVSSDPYSFRIYGNRIAEWTFNQILLPDSNRNEPASHGFLTFRINQIQVNEPGTDIINTAGIWFDYNAPILTPPAFHLVAEEEEVWLTVFIDPEKQPFSNLKVYPNPFRESTTFDLGGLLRTNLQFQLWDLQGRKVRESHHRNCTAFSLERKNLQPGLYFFTLTSSDGRVGSGRLMIH